MKTVVRNRNKEEGTPVQDTWYVLVSEEEVKDEEISSPLCPSEESALRIAEMEFNGTVYVAEIKLITKVVG